MGNECNQYDKQIKCLGIIVGCILVIRNITFIPDISWGYYVIMIISLLFMLFTDKVKISGTMTWLYIACGLSILFNRIPSFFHPYSRFLLFILMTLLISPAIVSRTFLKFRARVFVTIFILLQYVIILSALFGFTGNGFQHTYFQGITNHSMVLGPMSALSFLFCIYQFLHKGFSIKKNLFYIILMLMSLYCLLQAASRTAFIACIISLIVFLGMYNKNNLRKYFKSLLTISIIAIICFPIWRQYTDKLVSKNEGSATELSIDSRESHWESRIIEFKSNPLIGIGFSSVDINKDSGSTFSDDGKVETGSSWLAVLSMTGILGFIPLCIIFIISFRRSWKLWIFTPLLSSFLISLQCFWVLHMLAEGYIFAGGSSLFFCVWLLLGVMYSLQEDQQISYRLQEKLCR